jgi:hypothetical protein
MANVQKTFAIVLGAVLLLVGIIGFFMDPVIGIFHVNALHNWIHVLSGVVLLIGGLAANGQYAKTINIVFGVVYGLVAILGFAGILVPTLLEAQMSDNVLHIVIALVSLGVGLFVKD